MSDAKKLTEQEVHEEILKLQEKILDRVAQLFISEPTKLDYSQITDIEVSGIDTGDYPDFCDAYISNASYKGREMTESELEELNEDRDFVYEQVEKRLY